MGKAFIIAKTQEICDSISDIVYQNGFMTISTSTDICDARDRFNYTDFDLVVVSTPLSEGFGIPFIKDISQCSSAGIIVITKPEVVEEVQEKLSSCGVFVLARPLNKSMISQAIRFVMIARNEISKLNNKYVELEQKLDDVKLIDRAKCVLIQYLRISESQAHRHIQKQAMDQRVSQKVIAQDILKTYET